MMEDIMTRIKEAESTLEALKEFARYILSAVVGALVAWLAIQVEYLKPYLDDPTAYGLLVVIISGAFRGVDRYIHRRGQQEGNESLKKGLFRF